MYAVDRSGNVTAINLTDGRPLWQWQSGDLSGLLSAPLRNGRLLVVASVDGSLRALEAASGRVVWTRENCGSEVAPALTQDILAVATTDRRLLLLDADNGAPLHTITLPGRPATDLVVHGRTVLVATIDGDLLAADMGNGKTLWRQRLDRASGLRTSAIQPGFAVIGDSGVMTALSPTTGQSLWRVNLDGMPEGPPTSNGRHLAVAFAQRLLLLDPTNGSIRLQCPSSGEPWAGPVTFQENCLLAPRRDGTIRALSLEKLETLYQLRPEAALQARSVTVVGRSIAAGTRSRKLLLYRHP
jgi:outer membrane protein assembly factor BamB